MNNNNNNMLKAKVKRRALCVFFFFVFCLFFYHTCEQACFVSVFVNLVQKKQLFSCGDFQFQEAETEIFVFVL